MKIQLDEQLKDLTTHLLSGLRQRLNNKPIGGNNE
jgi:hypothetical protein